MKYFFLFLFILSSTETRADETWIYQDYHPDRKTSGYNLSSEGYHFNAEVVDYNKNLITERDRLDQFRVSFTGSQMNLGEFQAEIQGSSPQDEKEMGTFNSYLRHRIGLWDMDHASLSLQSQIFSPKNDARPGIGLPLHIKVNDRNSFGVSFMTEQGKYFEEMGPVRKYMTTVSYSRKLVQDLYMNASYYGERYNINQTPYNQMNLGFNYQTAKGLKLNFETYTSSFSKDYDFNHVLGASLFF